MKYFTDKYLLDVIRSSLFLAVNGGGFVVNVCLVRFVQYIQHWLHFEMLIFQSLNNLLIARKPVEIGVLKHPPREY